MLEIIQISGGTLSLVLCFMALYVRFVPYLDTTALAVDWSLLLIAFAGMQLFIYFYTLHADFLLGRAGLILGAAICYIVALLLWFIHMHRHSKRI